jgi:hypothetical protein
MAKCLGGSDDDIGQKILQLTDGSYLALCYTSSYDGDLSANPPSGVDAWLIKLDITGNIQMQQCLGGSFSDAAYDIQITPDGGAILTGLTNSNDGDVSGNHGDYDMWVVKLAPLPNNISSNLTNPFTDCAAYFRSSNLEISFYSNKQTNSQIQLFDIEGRILLKNFISVESGFNKLNIPSPLLSKGIYFVRMENLVRKVVVN